MATSEQDRRRPAQTLRLIETRSSVKLVDCPQCGYDLENRCMARCSRCGYYEPCGSEPATRS